MANDYTLNIDNSIIVLYNPSTIYKHGISYLQYVWSHINKLREKHNIM
jgi:hypothetical protein